MAEKRAGLITDSVANESLRNRLYNWKFEQAVQYLTPEQADGEIGDYVRDLADLFGNAGWFDGSLATLVQGTVRLLIGDVDD